MKSFDVCVVGRKSFGPGKDRLVVVLQHDSIEALTTTVVAPLFKLNEYRVVAKLTPVVEVKGERFVVAIDRLASVPKAELGKSIANLEQSRLDLLSATDFLFTGF